MSINTVSLDKSEYIKAIRVLKMTSQKTQKEEINELVVTVTNYIHVALFWVRVPGTQFSCFLTLLAFVLVPCSSPTIYNTEELPSLKRKEIIGLDSLLDLLMELGIIHWEVIWRYYTWSTTSVTQNFQSVFLAFTIRGRKISIFVTTQKHLEIYHSFMSNCKLKAQQQRGIVRSVLLGIICVSNV